MIYSIFIIPLIIIIAGYLMYRYPPKKINWFIGYRTSQSMKNQNMWQLANKYCGKLWIITGIIMIVITLFIYCIEYFNMVVFSETLLGVIVLMEFVPVLFSGVLVENKMKNMK